MLSDVGVGFVNKMLVQNVEERVVLRHVVQ